MPLVGTDDICFSPEVVFLSCLVQTFSAACKAGHC
jgi:hypothetical protein